MQANNFPQLKHKNIFSTATGYVFLHGSLRNGKLHTASHRVKIIVAGWNIIITAIINPINQSINQWPFYPGMYMWIVQNGCLNTTANKKILAGIHKQKKNKIQAYNWSTRWLIVFFFCFSDVPSNGKKTWRQKILLIISSSSSHCPKTHSFYSTIAG